MKWPLIWTVSTRRFRWGTTTYVFMQNQQKLSLIITTPSYLELCHVPCHPSEIFVEPCCLSSGWMTWQFYCGAMLTNFVQWMDDLAVRLWNHADKLCPVDGWLGSSTVEPCWQTLSSGWMTWQFYCRAMLTNFVQWMDDLAVLLWSHADKLCPVDGWLGSSTVEPCWQTLSSGWMTWQLYCGTMLTNFVQWMTWQFYCGTMLFVQWMDDLAVTSGKGFAFSRIQSCDSLIQTVKINIAVV